MSARRQKLDALTRRWRQRHDARADAAERDLPPADPQRASRARDAFPYRSMSPAAYADLYGSAMIGFTYDEFRYPDPELNDWLTELGRILRERRGADRG